MQRHPEPWAPSDPFDSESDCSLNFVAFSVSSSEGNLSGWGNLKQPVVKPATRGSSIEVESMFSLSDEETSDNESEIALLAADSFDSPGAF